MIEFEKIHELIGRAPKISVSVFTKELQITVSPEWSRPAGRPKLTKAKLLTRAKQRKKQDADKDGAS
uniref:Transcriptional regulator n=1 Tax=Haemonchus contortus TaxID=6289 RepID=A0A7I4Z3D7_HAECO